MSVRLARIAGSVLLAVATATVLVALGVLPFLHPAWIGFAQERAEAAAWTGYTAAELRTATDSIVADLIVGPPDFDVAIERERVLNAREQEHMRDVRVVFAAFGVAAALAALVLVVAAALSPRAAWVWRAVRAGAVALAAGVVVIGLIGVFAFELAFDVFHRLFFSSGTYTFDPASERLVQLFPQRFWFETSLAVGAVILVLAALAVIVATRRLRPHDASARAVPRTALDPAR